MKFTVITPTLQRKSLLKTCQMIDSQTHDDWQHIVVIDSEIMDYDLMRQVYHPNREVQWCRTNHRDGGNTCRNHAFNAAKGTYVLYCDDDNYYADDGVFSAIEAMLINAAMPPWALFPISRLGGRFYCDPPRSCHVDTMNVVLRHDYAQWPATDAYGSDGVLVDALMEQKVPYAAFPDFREIAVMPTISFGR